MSIERVSSSGTDDRYMKYHIDNVDASQGPTYEKAKKFGQMLLDNCTSSNGIEDAS
jgi:hypothetical protein